MGRMVVIIGAQWGDEGKGKIVDLLTDRAAADRERTELLAQAMRESEKIRGEGDARAAAIYAGVYQKNPEFYAFHRSLEAYRKSLGKSEDILVLSPDSEFFRYMNQSGR